MFDTLLHKETGYKVVRDVDGYRYLVKLEIPINSNVRFTYDKPRGKRRSDQSLPIECWRILKKGLGLKYEPLVEELHHEVFWFRRKTIFKYKIGKICKVRKFGYSDIECSNGIHYFSRAIDALSMYGGSDGWKTKDNVKLNKISNKFTYY